MSWKKTKSLFSSALSGIRLESILYIVGKSITTNEQVLFNELLGTEYLYICLLFAQNKHTLNLNDIDHLQVCVALLAGVLTWKKCVMWVKWVIIWLEPHRSPLGYTWQKRVNREMNLRQMIIITWIFGNVLLVLIGVLPPIPKLHTKRGTPTDWDVQLQSNRNYICQTTKTVICILHISLWS